MFGLIRVVLGCLLFIILNHIIARSKLAPQKINRVFLIILVVALVSASAFFPLENAFITFKSAESAFKYYTLEHKDVVLVVEGVSCDLVIANKNSSNTHLIIPKTTDGWKIGIGLDTRKIKQKLVDDLIIYVYQYRDTSDYFVVISSTTDQSLNIADSYGSAFLNMTNESSSLNVNFMTYYTHISEFNEDYRLYINNDQVLVWGDK